jgi:hypothetical protein
LNSGGDIYAPVRMADYLREDSLPPGSPEFFYPNLNPPFQTVLMAPLGLLDFDSAFLVWSLVSLACGAAAAVLVGIVAWGSGSRIRAGVTLAILLFAYFPTVISVEYGQWALLPLLFLVSAWSAWRKGRTGLAGAILGFLAAIKLFYGAFLLLFLSLRERRGALTFAFSWLLCTLVAIVLVGLDTTIRYVSIIGDTHWFSGSWNGSFLGFFSRVFGGGENTPMVDAPLLTPLLSYALAVLAVASLFFLRQPVPGGSAPGVNDDLPLAVAVPVMLLVSPLGWMYYFPFLLLPLAVLWRASLGLKDRRTIRLLLVVAWLLSAVPNPAIPPRDIGGNPAIIFIRSGVYFYTLLMFWGLGWWMQRALHRRSILI